MYPTAHLWEEPLYRLILQITLLQVFILSAVIIGIIVVRSLRLHGQQRAKHFSSELYAPLMTYLAGDMSLEAAYDLVVKYPRQTICRELERYAIMLGGDALAKIRALYERLNLRNYGIKLSHSWVWWRRLEGVRILGAAGGHDIVDVLLDSLSDRHAVVRLAAARSLGRTKNPRAIEPILGIMAESKQLSQRQLAQTLVAFGPAAYPALRRIVRQGARAPSDHRFIAMALEMLALTGDIESSREIRAALTSENIEVRIAGYKSAMLLHIPLLVTDLTQGLGDDEWPVRAQAALAAGKTGDPAIVKKLGECLSDRSWWVRNNAATALHQLGMTGLNELEHIRLNSQDAFARDMATRILSTDPAYSLVRYSEVSVHDSKKQQPSSP
ncbi:MAG: HEAT repeat domain-containing protein [Myxococcota bacterium]|nr:HEAT repeat domain-containing protein [Myxococcota bacterium]